MFPRELAEYLITEGFEASTAKRLKLRPDQSVWEYAEKHSSVVITKDSDYFQFPQDYSKAQLVHVTGPNMTTRILVERLQSRLPQIIEALLAGEKIIEVNFY